MEFLKKLSTAIILTLVFVFFYESYIVKKPCTSPISYTIGTFDKRFGISKDDFLNKINTASNVWNKSTDKKLFEYNPNGELVINLIYDDRQKNTQQNILLKANIEKVNNLAQSVKAEYLTLKLKLDVLKQEYANELNTFNQNQNNYNKNVSDWNSRGGAPEKEYNALNLEKQNLENEQVTLEQKSIEINSLVTQVNDFINKYNLLIDSTSPDINKINLSAGKEFEEGLYDPNLNVINIYEFSSSQKLTRVLIHELGHALDLDHNNNPKSIMYPINQGNNLSLSADDIAELKAKCNIP